MADQESKTDVVEKRVNRTIIRRRAKVEPPQESALAPREPTLTTPPPPSEKQALPQEPLLASQTRPTESKPAIAPVPPTPPPSPPAAKPLSPRVETAVQHKPAVPAAAVAPSPSPSEPPKKEAASVVSPVKPSSPASSDDGDRPRYGLKIVGRVDLKTTLRTPARPGSRPTSGERPSAAKPALPGTSLPNVPKLPSAEEEEEAKKIKTKKVAKKSKREEIEVDLEGIDKVATLTQLTRLAASPVPERVVERERVFEPGKNLRKKKTVRKELKKTELTTKKASKRIIKMGETMVVSDLAHEMSIKATEIVRKLVSMGMMVTVNQPIDFETASLIASEFGYEVRQDIFEEKELLATHSDTDSEKVHRPPVVTVMGHVDHGKTSLLDSIRKARVALGEAGGITQHIGAYQVKTEKGPITFIDTPGHEAFTAMRARGASVTDIVILVVAADDGVMPQTIEAIHHSQAAKVPIIVAVNKIDKPGADPDRVKRQLMEHQLVPEEWGGETIFAHVSAKTGQGIPELLEMILLQAEVLELKANPNKEAKGTVIESFLDKGRGPVATLLVQEGTLKVGDNLILGPYSAKVRAIRDDQGREIKQAGPSVPVEVIGLSGIPNAGEPFQKVAEDRIAKLLVEHREEKERNARFAHAQKTKLEDLFGKVQAGETRELRVILKGDVQGSVEALRESLHKLSTEKVRVNVLHSAVGGITESDVMLASASDAIIVGFNVRPDLKAKDLAHAEQVEIKLYNIIYNALEEIKKAMEGLLAPTFKEKYLGRAEVRNVFNISKVGAIAGSFVIDGTIQRGAKVRLLRDNKIVYDGKLSSLKRFKDDVKEVAQGYECGISLENFNDLKVGDVIEAYLMETIASKL